VLKNSYKAHSALLTANLIYGVNHIIAKDIMPHKIGPSAFIFLRLLIAGLLFWMIRIFIREHIERKDLPRLMLCGLFGAAANMLLFFHGLNLTSPVDASIIMTSGPVMVLLFSALLLKEKITPLKVLGLAVGGLGALLLILYGNRVSGTSSLSGNLLVFLNASCYGLYLVLVKPLMRKYHSITVVSWVFLFGFIFAFFFGIGDLAQTDFSAFTRHTYLTLAFVILGTTFLAYLLNIYALNHVTPSVNSSYIYLQPVISFVMVSLYAFLWNRVEYAKDITTVKILSCVLVVAGVYLISRASYEKKTA
jgi:drug/metabolite transporter (DMT)-like permease